MGEIHHIKAASLKFKTSVDLKKMLPAWGWWIIYLIFYYILLCGVALANENYKYFDTKTGFFSIQTFGQYLAIGLGIILFQTISFLIITPALLSRTTWGLSIFKSYYGLIALGVMVSLILGFQSGIYIQILFSLFLCYFLYIFKFIFTEDFNRSFLTAV